MSTSSNERGMSLRSPARFLAPAERLVVGSGVSSGADPAFADRVADAWIKAQAYRLHTFGTVTRVAGGGELGAESSVTKVFWSDLDVALHQTALDLRGADGELADALDRRSAVRARRPDLRRHQRDSAQHHRRAAARAARESAGSEANEVRTRRTAA